MNYVDWMMIKSKQLIDPEDELSSEDEEVVRQGITDSERGDIRSWSTVKHDLDL